MAERSQPQKAQDKLAFLLSLVPYLMDHDRVSVADAAAHFGVPQQPVVEPTPRYTVRVAAPKWEPPSITTELRKLTAAHMEQITRDADLRDNLAQDPLESHDQSIPDSLGISLNSILARRRAV